MSTGSGQEQDQTQEQGQNDINLQEFMQNAENTEIPGEEVEHQEGEEVEHREGEEVEHREGEVDPEIQRALDGGHVSKEEWIAQGKDPDDWVSARRFNQRGDLISTIKELQEGQKLQQQQFDQRLQNVNTLAALQLQQLQSGLSNLEAERREAIELADVERADELQKQIDQARGTEQILQQQTQTQQPQIDQDAVQLETDWNAKNPWVNTTDPTNPDYGKAVFAQQTYANLINNGVSTATALQQVDQAVAQKFQPSNPRRMEPNAMTPPKPKAKNKGNGHGLTWNDLTSSEVNMFNGMGGAWTKEEFLQTVADSRKS